MEGFRAIWGPAALALAATTVQAAAKEKDAPLPPAVTRLLDCRSIAASDARLACYDTQTAELARATEKSEIVVLDQEAVDKTRRSLFGFSLPALLFFRGGDGNEGGRHRDELTGIEATLATVRSLGYGKWAFSLDDGAQWQTTEGIPNRTPKEGMAIRIESAAMGSFKAKVNGWPAVRVKRVN